MRNAMLKKVLAFALSLTLIITMAPIIPGVAAKASAETLLPAPTITIDENGVATCTEVEGAAEYSWIVSRHNAIKNPGESYDVYNTLVGLGDDSDQYEVRVYARDASSNTISETGTIIYDFTSPHTHNWDDTVWEYDGNFGDEYHWHPCRAENCLTPNYLKAGVAKHEYYNGACIICGKERVLLPSPTITIAENGIATWSAVEGAAEYSVSIANYSKLIGADEERSFDIKGYLDTNGSEPKVYTFTVRAVDDNGDTISETATANYDARTIADTFVASSEDFKAPVYGESVTEVYGFTFTSEVNARVPSTMGHWYKKVGEVWEQYEGAVFTEGEYYYSNQLRLDSTSGTGSTHRLPEDKALDITINGEKWTSDDYVGVYDTYSLVYMNSPVYVVEKVALDLAFEDSASFDIKNLYQNRAIETKSVKDAVIGGEEPYVFSKTSGPSWLNVSDEGVISGTPDVIGGNDDLVVRVTDNKGDFKEITIDVDDTLMNPNDRTIADTFVASSEDFKAPVYGESVTVVYDFTFTSEVNARVPASMGHWYKKVGENWEQYTASIFGVGEYYYSNQLRLDSTSGTGSTHRLPEDGSTIDITINGEKWTSDEEYVGVYDTYSLVYMKSPVYKVGKPLPEVSLSQTSYIYDGTAKEPTVTVGSLEAGVDYTVSYSNNINAGTAKVIITGIGDYTGTITEYFVINANAPAPAKAELYGYDDVKFSWTKTPGASGYYVYYKKASASKYTSLGTTTALSKKKANLADGIEYDFKVVPYKKSGKKKIKMANIATASVYTLKAISTPKVTTAGATDGKFIISWANIKDVDGVEIKKCKTRTGTFTNALVTTDNVQNQAELAFDTGRAFYKIRAYKVVDGKKIYGPYSSIVVNPTKPATVKTELYGYDDVKVSWSKVPGASGYYVYYKKATSSKYTSAGTTTALYKKKSGLSDGIKYDFKVVPYYKSGKSKYKSSEYEVASIYTLKAPAKPKVTKDGAADGKFFISWTNIKDTDGVEIRAAKTSKGTYKSVLVTTDVSQNKAEVAFEKGYSYYKIRAYKVVNGVKIYTPYSSYVKKPN